MEKFWTDEVILKAKEILAKNHYLKDALLELSDLFQRPVTKNSISCGFKAARENPPGSYLKRQDLRWAGVHIDTDVVDFESGHKAPKEMVKFDGIRKALLLPDMHVPFHNRDAVMRAIDEDGDADLIVFTGDNIDCYQVGPHGARSVRTTLEKDTEDVIELISYIVRYKPAIWLDGNHERWIFKHQAKRTKECLRFLQQQANLGDYISYRINSKLGRINQLGHVVNPAISYIQPPNNWLCRINNVIVSHPDNFYGTQPLLTARRTWDHHYSRDPSIEGIIIGHTHRGGVIDAIFENAHIWACEMGCLCHEMDYSQMGNIKYKFPPTLGYGRLVFNDDGSLDKSKSGFCQ